MTTRCDAEMWICDVQSTIVCKGSSGSSGTNTVVQQSSPPAQFLNAYTNLIKAGTAQAEQPLQQYSGSLVAGFNPDQNQAFSTVENAQGLAQPYINAGAEYAGLGAQAVYPQVQQFSPSAISEYQSPYTQQVVQSTEAQLDQQNQIQQQQLQGSAASQGALGGDREAVAASTLAGQQQLQEAPTIANLYNTGYTTAEGELNTQQNLQANTMESDAWRAANAGYELGGLGTESENSALTGASAELNTGATQQGLAQEQLNIPYEEFEAQQAYPYQNLSWLGGLTEGAGAGAGGTSSTSYPGASSLSQILGAGAAGVGLLGETGAFGSSGYLSDLLGGSSSAAGLATDLSSAGGITGLGSTGADIGLAGLDFGATALASALFAKGGRVPPFVGRRRNMSWDTRRRLDAGGNSGAPPAYQGSNPNTQNYYAELVKLPPEKLQQLSVQMPPSSAQGQMVRKALQAKQMMPNLGQQPQAGLAQAPQAPQAPGTGGLGAAPPQQAQGPMPGSTMLRRGGWAHRAAGGAGGVAASQPSAVTFTPSPSYGIPLPQVSQSMFAKPSWSSNGTGSPGSYNPLPQVGATSGLATAPSFPSFSTSLPPSVLAALKGGASSSTPATTAAPTTSGPATIYNPYNPNNPLQVGLSAGGRASGSRLKMADGGDPDDGIMGGVEPPPGNYPAGIATPPPYPPPLSSQKAPQRPMGLNASKTMPLPPEPPPQGPSLPAGGLASSQSPQAAAMLARPGGIAVNNPDDFTPGNPSPWTALATAGFGMMAGRSPQAGVNIGEGGLKGLQEYEKEKDMDARPTVDHSGETIRVYYPSEKKWLDTGLPTEDSLKTQADIDFRGAQEKHYEALETGQSERNAVDQTRADAQSQHENRMEEIATQTAGREGAAGEWANATGPDGKSRLYFFPKYGGTPKAGPDGISMAPKANEAPTFAQNLDMANQEYRRTTPPDTIETPDQANKRWGATAQKWGIPLGNGQRPAATAQSAPATDPVAAARAAIQRGADPAAVAARLKANGIDPSGLNAP